MAPSMDAEPRRYAPPLTVPVPPPPHVPEAAPPLQWQPPQPSPAPARPALPPEERRSLRITGAIAGALIAAGAAVTLPVLGVLVMWAGLAFMGLSLFRGDEGFLLLVVGVGTAGALLVLAGWLVSVRRLRHWGPRGQRLTVTAAAISIAAAVLADGLLVVLLLVFDRSGEFPFAWLVIGVGAAAGLPVGALVGLCTWPWVAHLLRPAHPLSGSRL